MHERIYYIVYIIIIFLYTSYEHITIMQSTQIGMSTCIFFVLVDLPE